ncbi:MAG: hypothetical protein P1V20_28475 [Verrucomicrobiales bacterium]|nr:hypothetical protein [Verrucomicrobiales bacterium]
MKINLDIRIAIILALSIYTLGLAETEQTEGFSNSENSLITPDLAKSPGKVPYYKPFFAIARKASPTKVAYDCACFFGSLFMGTVLLLAFVRTGSERWVHGVGAFMIGGFYVGAHIDPAHCCYLIGAGFHLALGLSIILFKQA